MCRSATNSFFAERNLKFRSRSSRKRFGMEDIMFDKLQELVNHAQELEVRLTDPSVMADQILWQKTVKEHASLTPIVEAFGQFKKAQQNLEDSQLLLEEDSDEELREMAKEEIAQEKKNLEVLAEQLKILLLPKDPNDERNVYVEVRAGAGGDEAALFAAEIYRMYSRYAERRGWKTEITSFNENGLGGFKEIVFMIKGQGAYSRLKYESGVHRVQRVPVTESGGRIHTSTITVAVLPEADEVDVELNMNEIRIDVFRASGNGGQCVNTTDSAVRVTHYPTGIVISCQDEKSQLKNKDKALRVLRARLYELEIAKQQAEISADRRSQVGTGDRSEKIRTYNFPQTRVTDHRVKLTTHRLPEVLDGELDEIIDYIVTIDQTERLKSMENE